MPRLCRPASIAVLLALACSTQTAAQTGVTLEPSHTDNEWPLSVEFNGTAPAGATVELQADPYPRDQFVPVASMTAGGDGSYQLRHQPDRNAAYRAVAGEAASSVAVVYTDVAATVRIRRLRSGRFRILWRLSGPAAEPDYAGRRVHFYHRRGRARRWPKVGSALLRGRDGRFEAVAVVKAPRFRRGDRFPGCFREPRPDAWGRPYPGDRHCGRRVMLARWYGL